MVQLHGVSKLYPNRVLALNEVQMEIQQGEFVFLCGASGAGKSTLLKLLYAEEMPTAGEVWVDQLQVNRLRRKQVPLLRRRVGVVFQDFRLLPQHTVYDNVAFTLIVTEASQREIRRRVPAVLEMVGLAGRAKAMPNQLSGGEQQRVALARALVNNPVLLLADEPTGNLDRSISWEILNLLLEINDRGTTVIMSTHAYDLVDASKRRVITMQEGMVVRDEARGAYAVQG